MKNISELIHESYADFSLEVQKKIQYLTINNIIMLIFSILVISDNIFRDFYLIGLITGFFTLFSVILIFIFIFKKYAEHALNGFLLFLISLLYFMC